jgi:hypothetical protein
LDRWAAWPGKTAVAARIARKHGLRWYGTDTRTWQHRDRALAIRTDDLPITRRMLAVDLDGSRRIGAALVGCLVDP